MENQPTTEVQTEVQKPKKAMDLDFMDGEEKNLTKMESKVKADDLTFGVYPMQIIGMCEHKNRNNESMLKITIDTGYLTTKGTTREFNVFFFYNGVFADGKERASMLIQFFKRVTGKEHFTSMKEMKAMLNVRLSVATKKDKDGYFAYWYCGNIKDLERMKDSYRTKDESFGKVPDVEKNDDLPF